MFDTLINLDHEIFNFINNTAHHSLLDTILVPWRHKLTWVPAYILLSLVVAKKYGKQSWLIFLLIGLTIALADQASSQWIKKTVMRLRPCRTESLQDQIRILVHCGGGFSFTSSHACNSFAIATQLFLVFKNFWSPKPLYLLFIWAGVVAYAQVYVGVHFPFDVLCGSILGCFLASILHLLFKSRLKKLNKQLGYENN
jgi:membrane-associated phospholipid phosphatase